MQFASPVLLLVAFQSIATAFLAGSERRTPFVSRINLEMKVGLYYGTSTGNTENVAEVIASLSDEIKLCGYIDDFTGTDDCDAFIFGAPTWHTGADTERSGTTFDSWLYEDLPQLEFGDKPVALFGVGDAGSYSSNFCDALGELYDCFTQAGVKVVGAIPCDGIDFDESKAIRNGKFVGAVFDEDNEPELTEARASYWLTVLRATGFPL